MQTLQLGFQNGVRAALQLALHSPHFHSQPTPQYSTPVLPVDGQPETDSPPVINIHNHLIHICRNIVFIINNKQLIHIHRQNP